MTGGGSISWQMNEEKGTFDAGVWPFYSRRTSRKSATALRARMSRRWRRGPAGPKQGTGWREEPERGMLGVADGWGRSHLNRPGPL
jgi:hypothetical protein